jgi:DNA (cytosine-5)-methyltransferase 1
MSTFYEFFAGGGMARAGLGSGWTCLFSNDCDEKKAATYRANWGGEELLVKDVGTVDSGDLPGITDLAWASFPCQDLSLAGMGAGLVGARSGSFWPFWKLMQGLHRQNRGPKVVVLENVCGALTSHAGKDFQSLVRALRVEGYRVGSLVIDAALFVPQSRPRLFIVGISEKLEIDESLISGQPKESFHTPAVIAAYKNLSQSEQAAWAWWNIPSPKRRKTTFADIFEEDVPWHTSSQTRALLDMMSPVNLRKVETAKRMGTRVIGGVYKRTRLNSTGDKVQRAEVRFDDVAGCLRTPGGGSSRQSILVVEGDRVRSRLLSPREGARLMGLPDHYHLPSNYNEAYHLLGDGLAVPVVRHLSRYLLEPLLLSGRSKKIQAA